MPVEEKLKNKLSHKLFVIVVKYIPMLIATIIATNSVLSFFNIETVFLSYIGGTSFLTILFMYLSSIELGFCSYHRMFIHYILTTNIVNITDLYIGIPISDINYLGLQVE